VAPPTQASFVRAGEDSGGDPAFGPLAFSTDGRLLLARFGRRSNASVVRAFDPVTALPVHLPRTLVVGRAAMDPDGTVYGARGTFEEGPYQSDLKLYRGREALLDPSDDPFDVALSPDGKALLFTTVTDYNLGKPDPSLWYMRLGDPGPILIAEGGERGVWPVGEVPGSRPERALPVIEREPAFVAQLPRGWRREPVRSGSEGLKLFSYVKDDLYVHVFAWPNRSIGRSEYKADLTWDLVSREDMTGFDVRKEGPPCTGGDYCERGDGQLAIAGEIVRPVGGIIHDTGFLLKFGSTARETGVDLDVFREILGSFIIE
jgi:hypothetical protein